MKKQTISVTHIGEDYATIEVNGKEIEVTVREAKVILAIVKNYK